jgi:hypothetical protein
VSITARYPNAQEFLAWESDIDPARTPALQNLDAAEQQAILAALHEEMQTPLHDVIQGNEVVMPSHAHIALVSDTPRHFRGTEFSNAAFVYRNCDSSLPTRLLTKSARGAETIGARERLWHG